MSNDFQAPMPLTAPDIVRSIVWAADLMELPKLARLNKAYRNEVNKRFAQLFFDKTKEGKLKAFGFEFNENQFLTSAGAAFRGDDRGPGTIFGLGFTKKSMKAPPQVYGDGMITGIVSVTKDAKKLIESRKAYVDFGWYVYAVSDFPAIDTENYNYLQELAAFFIPACCVVAAAGPIKSYSKQNLTVSVDKLYTNPVCTLDEKRKQAAVNGLKAILDDPNIATTLRTGL